MVFVFISGPLGVQKKYWSQKKKKFKYFNPIFTVIAFLEMEALFK